MLQKHLCRAGSHAAGIGGGEGLFASCVGYTKSFMLWTNHLGRAAWVSVFEEQGHLVLLLQGVWQPMVAGIVQASQHYLSFWVQELFSQTDIKGAFQPD